MTVSSKSLWKKNYPMKHISSWGAGGVVRDLFEPQQVEDVLAHRDILLGSPTIFVGYGSNLLIRDGGFDGIVVHTAKLNKISEEGGYIRVQCGVGCPKFARYSATQGIESLAFLVGIPGTIGGALAMNAGCHGSEIWDWVEQVDVLTAEGITQKPRTAFTVNYRAVQAVDNKRTFFMGGWFARQAGSSDNATDKIRALLQQRQQTQPITHRTCGSVFRNPPNHYAGKLIEQCQLKGLTVGGAAVSEKHGNFIINNGSATASDIERLINTVQKNVFEGTGIRLEPEVQIMGVAA